MFAPKYALTDTSQKRMFGPKSAVSDVFPKPVPQSIVGTVLCEDTNADPNRDTPLKTKSTPAVYLSSSGALLGFNQSVPGGHLPDSFKNSSMELYVYSHEKKKNLPLFYI